MSRINNLQILKNRRIVLRKNQTKEETVLWNLLRRNQLGYKFKRQHSIGIYIVDFYCPSKRLIIELDGVQHLDNKEYDTERTNYFNSKDIKVIRFWNSEILKNISYVIDKISSELL